MRWTWSLNVGGSTSVATSTRRSPGLIGSRLPTRREIPPPAAYAGQLADDPGTGMGSLWNQRQAQDVSVGEGHDAADPGPCTINGLGEVSDEAYPHRTTEGPERTPVA